jgi:hypothetical protein
MLARCHSAFPKQLHLHLLAVEAARPRVRPWTALEAALCLVIAEIISHAVRSANVAAPLTRRRAAAAILTRQRPSTVHIVVAEEARQSSGRQRRCKEKEEAEHRRCVFKKPLVNEKKTIEYIFKIVISFFINYLYRNTSQPFTYILFIY